MEAMRALEHEYANRLHVVDGLLEMGEVEQAKSYVSQISSMSRSLGEGLRARIAPPELAALLLAKITVAAEQDVHMEVTAGSRLERPQVDQAELLTIVGNLLDNAVDALAKTTRPRTVTVQFDDADGVFIAVRDNGPASRQTRSSRWWWTAIPPRTRGLACGAESGWPWCGGSSTGQGEPSTCSRGRRQL
ncbi:sensor protein CitS (plasmid) [Arthrobacter sp. Hiyo8]|nr:sensor protein CitS [Arthrobacter sp. Hiyo8]